MNSSMEISYQDEDDSIIPIYKAPSDKLQFKVISELYP